jgi:hypothetical protein
MQKEYHREPRCTPADRAGHEQGANALRSNATGIGNTASGYDALRSNRTGIRNTANGVGALFGVTIGSMGSVSEKLLGLRPVTFRYTQPYDDGSKPVQFGLIAEEVAEVMPELVVNGKDGKPETVSYHLLATLLLNEVQKDHRVIQAQTARTEALEQQVQTQAAQLAALNKQVAVLAKLVGNTDKARMVASAGEPATVRPRRSPGSARRSAAAMIRAPGDR